jgi:hypothetical protein
VRRNRRLYWDSITVNAVLELVAAYANSNLEINCSNKCVGQGENKFTLGVYLHAVTNIQIHYIGRFSMTVIYLDVSHPVVLHNLLRYFTTQQDANHLYIYMFRGIFIRNNLIRIRFSLICKLSGTPD